MKHSLEHATLLRDLEVKVTSMHNLVALTRNGRFSPKELDGKLRAEWLRVESDLRRMAK